MENMKDKLKKQGGFTLIEMLLVVAIIAILVAVSIPVVGTNLEKARDATDRANERAAKTLAMMLYMGEIDPMNLPGCTWDGYKTGSAFGYTEDYLGNKSGIFYDAENGVLTFERPKGYGQCTGCGKIDTNGQTHVGHVIVVKVDAQGVFTATWTPDQLEEDVV